MFVCVGCIAHVNYRNWNILPECDAWTVYWLGKWICRCFPCMAAERYGGSHAHCRVRGEKQIIVVASSCSGLSFGDEIKWSEKAQSIVRLCTRFDRPWQLVSRSGKYNAETMEASSKATLGAAECLQRRNRVNYLAADIYLSRQRRTCTAAITTM